MSCTELTVSVYMYTVYIARVEITENVSRPKQELIVFSRHMSAGIAHMYVYMYTTLMKANKLETVAAAAVVVLYYLFYVL